MRRINGMIMSPRQKNPKTQNETSAETIELHRQRRRDCRVRHHIVNVKNESHEGDCSEPNYESQVRPLLGGAQALGNRRLVCPLCLRATDKNPRSAAADQNAADARARFRAEKSFLVCERNFLEIGAVALRAAQVHLVTPCSPTSVWL